MNCLAEEYQKKYTGNRIICQICSSYGRRFRACFVSPYESIVIKRATGNGGFSLKKAKFGFKNYLMM